MLQAIMAHFVQQEETNRATNERLAAVAAALGTLDGENDEAETARSRIRPPTRISQSLSARFSQSEPHHHPPRPQPKIRRNRPTVLRKSQSQLSRINASPKICVRVLTLLEPSEWHDWGRNIKSNHNV
ncbi:hypothetical protein DY000_02052672 [Brassica cretica]|uniref:Uncharacterized protein n=1 Tax=Brassica cretica TaxID=69181 RepID=A0ABQ7AGP8_BRACR|nr:hypothetical protein DY000_02052672 [Brassica cretica]